MASHNKKDAVCTRNMNLKNSLKWAGFLLSRISITKITYSDWDYHNISRLLLKQKIKTDEINERKKIELKWRIHLVILLIVCKGFWIKGCWCTRLSQCHTVPVSCEEFSSTILSFAPFCELPAQCENTVTLLLIHPEWQTWPEYLNNT